MKSAILFTGQLRTIQRTADLLKANIIDPNGADLFLYCEERLADEQYGTQEPGSLDYLKKCWGSSIKSLVVADQNTRYWQDRAGQISYRSSYRELCAERVQSEAGALWYRSTGSALEYMQLSEAYNQLREEEMSSGQKYDLIARCRFDVALFRPLVFRNYYDPEIFWESIFKYRDHARKMGWSSSKLLYAALLSGGDSNMMEQILRDRMAEVGYSGVVNGDNLGDCIRANSGDILHDKYLQVLKAIDLREPCSNNYTSEFLKGTCSVFTIRGNVIYFTRREFFDRIVSISDHVGRYESGLDADWCSENQMGMHLINSGLLSLNYHSELDEHYLLNMELGSATISENNHAEKFIPRDLLWTIIRKTKNQAREDWLKLNSIDTSRGAVSITS